MPRFGHWLLEFDVFPEFDGLTTLVCLPDMFTYFTREIELGFLFYSFLRKLELFFEEERD